MVVEFILFGIVGFLGYVIVCTIAGFIFMIAFELVSIFLEESYNVVHDVVTFLMRSPKVEIQ